MPEKEFNIKGRKIGTGNPCFIIAEAGVNHNGSVELAIQMIKAAANAGADAVKFQTFKAENLATDQAPKAAYQKAKTQENESQLEMLKKLELSDDAYPTLMAECDKNNILFMSSPFDETSTDMLDAQGIAAFKIPSGEITNLPYLTHVARKNKPIILSTGMSYLDEVELAVKTIFSAGNHDLALLHCTSNYPAKPEGINLRAMATLSQTFHLPIGFSDHSEGIDIPVAAVAMGAVIVEKHFTLDRTLPGPDQTTSLEPDVLRAMVASIRKIELAMGDGIKKPYASEAETASVARKSIVSSTIIIKGTKITEAQLTMKRPGTGLPSSMLSQVIGRIATTDIPAGSLITLEMLG